MKEIKKIYLVQFLIGLSNTATVIFTLYLLSHGMKQIDIALLFGFFMVVLAVFDIPTGAIADIFGYKVSVGIGIFLQGLSCLLFFLYPTYIGFFVGMFVDALGLAFQSGATISLIYDMLQKEQHHEGFQKIFGRATSYLLCSTIIASPIGSLLFVHSQGSPLIFAFFILLLASGVVFSIRSKYTKRQVSFVSYFQTIGKGIRLTVQNKMLIAIVIIGSVLTLARLLLNQNISQPYQVSVGIPVSMIGIVIAVISLLQAGVSFYAHALYKKMGRLLSLLIIVGIPSLAIMGMSITYTIIALPLLFIFYSGLMYRDSLFAYFGQEEVSQENRSTMSSTVSFLTSIFAGIALPLWGILLEKAGIHSTLLLLGIFCFVVGAIGVGIIILPDNKLSQSRVVTRQ